MKSVYDTNEGELRENVMAAADAPRDSVPSFRTKRWVRVTSVILTFVLTFTMMDVSNFRPYAQALAAGLPTVSTDEENLPEPSADLDDGAGRELAPAGSDENGPTDSDETIEEISGAEAGSPTVEAPDADGDGVQSDAGSDANVASASDASDEYVEGGGPHLSSPLASYRLSRFFRR